MPHFSFRLGIVSLIILAATAPHALAEAPADPTDHLWNALREYIDQGEEGPETVLTGLLKKRCQAEYGCFANRFQNFIAGKGTNPFLFQNARRLIDAALELLEETRDRPSQLKLLEANVELAQVEASMVQRRAEVGREDPMAATEAWANLLDTQIRLLKWQRKLQAANH